MIHEAETLASYFTERIEVAIGRLGVQPTILTQCYLAGLLSEQACGHDFMSATLVEYWERAIAANDRTEQVSAYRTMGDAALYMCGFFGERLEARGLSNTYVCSMGAQAYGAAASLSGAQADVFSELAGDFMTHARVIDEVKEGTDLRTPQEIVKLYDRWRRTRSPVLAERLRQEGVFPVRKASDVLQ